jgi:hypothetical protein
MNQTHTSTNYFLNTPFLPTVSLFWPTLTLLSGFPNQFHMRFAVDEVVLKTCSSPSVPIFPSQYYSTNNPYPSSS